MTEHRRNISNQHSKFMKSNIRDNRRIRKDHADQESQVGHEPQRQAELGAVVAPNNTPLFICMKMKYMLICQWVLYKINNRKLRENLKRVVL